MKDKVLRQDRKDLIIKQNLREKSKQNQKREFCKPKLIKMNFKNQNSNGKTQKVKFEQI